MVPLEVWMITSKRVGEEDEVAVMLATSMLDFEITSGTSIVAQH